MNDPFGIYDCFESFEDTEEYVEYESQDDDLSDMLAIGICVLLIIQF